MWLTGLVALRHVGSSQTRARTRVPCIGRQILNHCATREAPFLVLTAVPGRLKYCFGFFSLFWVLFSLLRFLGKHTVSSPGSAIAVLCGLTQGDAPAGPHLIAHIRRGLSLQEPGILVWCLPLHTSDSDKPISKASPQRPVLRESAWTLWPFAMPVSLDRKSTRLNSSH